MHDPAFDADDNRQDAQLAILEGRIGERAIPALIANAKRTNHRRAKCHQEHAPKVAQHFEFIRPEGRDPAEMVSDRELAEESARLLFREDQVLLITLLLREKGFSRKQTASITGQSEGTVSRSRHRATALCRGLTGDD